MSFFQGIRKTCNVLRVLPHTSLFFPTSTATSAQKNTFEDTYVKVFTTTSKKIH